MQKALLKQIVMSLPGVRERPVPDGTTRIPRPAARGLVVFSGLPEFLRSPLGLLSLPLGLLPCLNRCEPFLAGGLPFLPTQSLMLWS